MDNIGRFKIDTLSENYIFKIADTCFVFSANVLLFILSTRLTEYFQLSNADLV